MRGIGGSSPHRGKCLGGNFFVPQWFFFSPFTFLFGSVNLFYLFFLFIDIHRYIGVLTFIAIGPNCGPTESKPGLSPPKA